MSQTHYQPLKENMERDPEGFAVETAPVVNRRTGMYWKVLLFLHTLFVTCGVVLLYHTISTSPVGNHLNRRWGGFEDNPTTNKCYRQERTAMLLNLFLGWLGADQFYAHHWPLAVFKLLLGLGAGGWTFGIAGIVLASKGHKSSGVVMTAISGLIGVAAALWILIDMVLWIVGGVYGTPGCPGGGASGLY